MSRFLNRRGAAGWGALLALVAGSASLLACGDSCPELQTLCDGCLDPNQRASCEEAVDNGSDESCARDIESYQDICQ